MLSLSDEIKIEEEKKCNCFCHSKGFRKFLVVAAGTFVGVYLALSLFAAIHKPPMPVPMPMPAPCPCQQMMFRPDFGPLPPEQQFLHQTPYKDCRSFCSQNPHRRPLD